MRYSYPEGMLMRRVVQPNLSRGHVADRLAIVLAVSLLAVLVASFYSGVTSLS
jgi:hypothetical protein